MRIRHVLITLLIAVLVFSVSGCSQEKEGAVSIVNGEEISRDEFNVQFNRVKKMFAEQGVEELDKETEASVMEMIVNQMVAETVVLQAAKAADISVDDTEVEEQINNLESQFSNREEFKNYLKSFSITTEELEKEMLKSLTIQRYFENTLPSVEITEQEIKEYFNSIKETLGEDVEYDDIVDALREQLKSEKLKELENEHIEKLKDDAEIEILI